jgi:hypothetical protein
MRSMKQVVVAIAAGGLLVAGGTTAGIVLTQGTARADNVAACIALTGTGSMCQLDTQTVPDPSDIYLQLFSPEGAKDLQANLSWSVSCPSSATAQTGSVLGEVPSVVYIAQAISIPSSESCTVTATMDVVDFNSNTQNAEMELNYDEGTGTGTSAPTPNPSGSVPTGGVSGIIKGYDGKCVNDSGNSSKLRAQVVSYACGSAKGKTWRYAAGELIHNNMCLNDQGNAGNGGKLILYTCNGSADELWVHQLNNTYELKAHNWTLCLTIPGSSKQNGVQLRANTCHNGANQHWNVP